jgi:hypothetical protein
MTKGDSDAAAFACSTSLQLCENVAGSDQHGRWADISPSVSPSSARLAAAMAYRYENRYH